MAGSPNIILGFPAALIAWLMLGCASLQESASEQGENLNAERYQLPDDTGFPSEFPHGTPVRHDEIPDSLRAKHNFPDNASVERMGNDPEESHYRVQPNSIDLNIDPFLPFFLPSLRD